MEKPQQLVQDEDSNLERFTQLSRFAQSVYEANPDNLPLQTIDIAHPEVQEFLKSLHRNHVKYMLAGGIATVFYGYVRTTQDLDLWVQETVENKKQLVQALEDIAVPGAANFENVELIAECRPPVWSTITIGEAGFVADFMGYTKAFAREDFDACYQRARQAKFGKVTVTIIHIDDLIEEKKKLGRLKDLDDVQNLERIIALKKGS